LTIPFESRYDEYMDAAQMLLLAVIVILTLILVLLGIQVFLILKEFRRTVLKVNKVLDDTGVISESIATPVSNLSGIFGGVKAGLSLLTMLKKKKKIRKIIEVEEEDEDGEQA
jgi:hypothetical protein